MDILEDHLYYLDSPHKRGRIRELAQIAHERKTNISDSNRKFLETIREFRNLYEHAFRYRPSPGYFVTGAELLNDDGYDRGVVPILKIPDDENISGPEKTHSYVMAHIAKFFSLVDNNGYSMEEHPMKEAFPHTRAVTYAEGGGIFTATYDKGLITLTYADLPNNRHVEQRYEEMKRQFGDEAVEKELRKIGPKMVVPSELFTFKPAVDIINMYISEVDDDGPSDLCGGSEYLSYLLKILESITRLNAAKIDGPMGSFNQLENLRMDNYLDLPEYLRRKIQIIRDLITDRQQFSFSGLKNTITHIES